MRVYRWQLDKEPSCYMMNQLELLYLLWKLVNGLED
jgi:hypothetical protein